MSNRPAAPQRSSANRNAPPRPATRTAAPISTLRSAMEAASGGAPPARLSDEQIKAERASAMRAKDPVLGAAIDALDLELLD